MPNKWAIAIAASVIHALHATAVYTVPTTLMSPMRQSLNLSMKQITAPITMYRLVQTFLLLPAGFALNAMGPQLSIRLSMTFAAILAPFLSIATTLNQLLVLQFLFSFTKLFGGLSGLLLIVNRAFPSRVGIGTATSIVLSGYSFAGFFAPIFIGIVSDRLGWRLSSFILSILFAVVAVPLSFHYMRDPDAVPFSEQVRKMRQAWSNRSWSYQKPAKSNPTLAKQPAHKSEPQEPLFSLSYLLVLGSVLSFSFSMHLIFDHLIIYLCEDLKIPFAIATRYMSLINLSSLLSKLTVGPISDRFNKSTLIAIFGLVGMLCSFLLLDFVTPFTFVATASVAKITLFSVLCKSFFFFPSFSVPLLSNQLTDMVIS